MMVALRLRLRFEPEVPFWRNRPGREKVGENHDLDGSKPSSPENEKRLISRETNR